MIGIVTINDFNYGNRLQNLAMLQIVKEYDEAFNLLCDFENFKLKPFDRLKVIVKKIFLKNERERVKNFKRFNKKYINNYPVKLKRTMNFENINKKFDAYIVGSDQIWNPNFYPNMYFNFLGFAGDKKKIAVSPSISVSLLTNSQKDEFVKYIDSFDYLSCREREGCELLKEFTNKEIIHLIDPTLYLDREFWFSKCEKPVFHDETKEYILVYALGEKEKISKFADENKFKIIDILDKNTPYYRCGPSQFLYLIKNARLVLTDSYHASIFSFLFNTPMIIFERIDKNVSMNSRITNLVEVLDIRNRLFKNINLNEIFITNYNYTLLEKYKAKFNLYIRETIGKVGFNNESVR